MNERHFLTATTATTNKMTTHTRITFDGCGCSVVRNSREHDEAICDENGENWFCGNCYDGRYDEEEDDEWCDVYDVIENFEVGNITGTYYQTFGGGPEGGYVETNDTIYHITRTWFEEWKIFTTPYKLERRNVDWGSGIQIKSSMKPLK